jgi:hypothetical protein
MEPLYTDSLHLYIGPPKNNSLFLPGEMHKKSQ